MQPKQQRALELNLAGHSVTDIASQMGVRMIRDWWPIPTPHALPRFG